MDSEQQDYIKARNEALQAKEDAMALRKMNIEIRSEFLRTKNFGIYDPEKNTPTSLSRKYGMSVEKINLIIK